MKDIGLFRSCLPPIVLLAAKRKLDMELAAAIGLLHDVYRYKTGISTLHSQNGA